MSDMRNEANFNQVMKAALRVVANKVFEESQLNIVNKDISDTGYLLKSGTIVPTMTGHRINYSAPYAWQIEKGRLPGNMPPVEALEKWVGRKLGVPREKRRSVSWAIATNIKKYGTQPQPFMEEAIMKVSKMVFRIEVAS